MSMEEVVGMIRELADIVSEVHQSTSSGNSRALALSERIETLRSAADQLLPEKPASAVPISAPRSLSDWDALAGRSPVHGVK